MKDQGRDRENAAVGRVVPEASSHSPWESRRRFLGGAAAIALWPGLAAAQHITANTPPQPAAADQDTAALAARTDTDRHLTIAVLINGHGPFDFVVDTGAERSVISESVAAILNLPSDVGVTIQGIAKAIRVNSVRADTVSFGPFVRNDVLLPILPQSTLAADGYLGLDVINGTRVTFDFKHGQLRIEQPKTLLAPETKALGTESPGTSSLETRVRARGKAGRLEIMDCMVDSVAAVAFVDTGAEVSVGNRLLLEALQQRRRRDPVFAEATLTGVTGGELEADVVRTTRIKVQDLNFTSGTLDIADVPDFDAWNVKFRPGLLIGMDYLRQFAEVTVDYRAKEIRFELSLAPPRPLPGVEIRAQA